MCLDVTVQLQQECLDLYDKVSPAVVIATIRLAGVAATRSTTSGLGAASRSRSCRSTPAASSGARAGAVPGDRRVSGLVSIVMPVLDAEAWLDEAIGSVLTQTYPDFELVIVDDGSRDASRDIAAAAAERDPRIRLLALAATRPDERARAANAGIEVRAALDRRIDATTLPDERPSSRPSRGERDRGAAGSPKLRRRGAAYWYRKARRDERD